MKTQFLADLVLNARCPMCNALHELNAKYQESNIIRCDYCSRQFKITQASIRKSIKEWKATLNRMKYNNGS